MNELVSVIIPCYNGALYIEDCLNALLRQTYNKIQIVAVDDGSTDDTYNILNTYVSKFKNSGKDLIVLRQHNSGQAAAVNLALKEVKGEYLCWQDCDDTFQSNAIESFVDFLNKNLDYDLVRAQVNYTNSDMDSVLKVAKSNYPERTDIFDLYVYETDSYCFAGTFMVRMAALDRVIKLRTIDTSRAGQNWQLILPVAYKAKCGYIEKPLYNYRQLENSHSHSNVNRRNLLKKCDLHQELLINIINNIDEMDSLTKIKYRVGIHRKYALRKLDIIFKKQKQFIKRMMGKK